MDVVLLAGLWLPSAVWDDVAALLETHGHRALPVLLPGQDDGAVAGGSGSGGGGGRDVTATLADQEAAVLAAVDGADGRPLVVGHSAAASLAWLAADRRPERVAAVALVGGFPVADGEAYADVFPVQDGVMPFPGWGPFEGPDTADLDEAARRSLGARVVPVPQAVSQGVVRLRDERRHDVPVVVVCPEFSPAQAREAIADGQSPELARAAHVSYVDLDSGHWPMVTAPAELARLLAQVADGR